METKIQKIIRLRKEGLTYGRIAQMIGCSRQYVWKVCKANNLF